jgi:segregation and condensation protein A
METTNPIVELEIFQGPLDLLLYLIHKNEINIYDIPIATITQQYPDHLELMQELNLERSCRIHLLAIQLIEIKIRLLLWHRPSEEATESGRSPAGRLWSS